MESNSSSARRIVSVALASVCLLVPHATHAQTPYRLRVAAAIGSIGHGRHTGQGYLGIMFHDVSDEQVNTLRLHDARGAEIVYIDHDGPACKAGLKEHDVVLSVNGTLIQGEDQLRKLLHDSQPGKGLSIVISRDGSQQTLGVVLADRDQLLKEAWKQHFTVPEPQPPAGVEDASAGDADDGPSGLGSGFSGGHLSANLAYTGVTLDPVGAQLAQYFGIADGKGLLVHGVDQNSPAALAGLHAGDVITRINNRRVATQADWYHSLRDSKGKPLSLTVMRDHHEQTLSMPTDPKHRSRTDQPAHSDSPPRLAMSLH